MPITPTNISKTSITPTGASRGAVYNWGDTLYTWGDAVATWGYSYAVTNVTKNVQVSTTTVIGSPIGLLLTLTYATATSSGSGWTNINKN